MGARQRLNSLYFFGALIVAAVLGGVTDSWLVFLLTAAVLTATLIHGGDIRPGPTLRHRVRKRRR
ncbi:MAG: hypothetical protein KDA90_09215 [Planctomycetaceae bacterium]|nr:hypothetical protein [Planctomycetaceae bacterium]